MSSNSRTHENGTTSIYSTQFYYLSTLNSVGLADIHGATPQYLPHNPLVQNAVVTGMVVIYVLLHDNLPGVR